jgi:hypothetical protein
MALLCLGGGIQPMPPVLVNFQPKVMSWCLSGATDDVGPQGENINFLSPNQHFTHCSTNSLSIHDFGGSFFFPDCWFPWELTKSSISPLPHWWTHEMIAIETWQPQLDDLHIKCPFSHPSSAIVKVHPHMYAFDFKRIPQFYLSDTSPRPSRTPFQPNICHMKVQTSGSLENDTGVDFDVQMCSFNSVEHAWNLFEPTKSSSPLTGTLALFLWEGRSLYIYLTLEALCPAVFIALVGRFKFFSTIYGEKCCLFFRHLSLKKAVKNSNLFHLFWASFWIFHLELTK